MYGHFGLIHSPLPMKEKPSCSWLHRLLIRSPGLPFMLASITVNSTYAKHSLEILPKKREMYGPYIKYTVLMRPACFLKQVLLLL